MNKKIRAIGALILALLWVFVAIFAWVRPSDDMSISERRPLDKFPKVTWKSIMSVDFMTDFESYTLDQFPMRDTFRKIKALFHKNVMLQKDNNDIYIVDGYAAEMAYPMNEASVDHAISQFNKVYEMYLKETGSNVVVTVVPDKSYYLAEENGYLSFDYQQMFGKVQSGMPWAEYVDITDCLTIEDYYYTDTHWRQEKILPVAQKLSDALGVTAPKSEDFTVTAMERPFYGVYYGQAALPMDPETMYLMENDLLDQCTVFNYTDGKTTKIYDENKLDSLDQYDIYLSGPQSMLRIENPNATTDRELIVFRDSYGGSLVPLLVQDYAVVTLVDIRTNYILPERLGSFIEFNGQDVLFMYSSLVLNKNLI